jgi:hypothetical protein
LAVLGFKLRALNLPFTTFAQAGFKPWPSYLYLPSSYLTAFKSHFYFLLTFFFFSTGVWTQGLHLEPLHTSPVLWWVFSSWGVLMNYLPGLAPNLDPPDLCLLSGQDYRCKPLVPGCFLLTFNLTFLLWI